MGWWLIKTPWEFTFVVDTQTHRWGSIAAGIERVAEQRPAIEEAYTTDDRARQTRARRDLVFPTAKRLDADTFDVLTDLLSVLHPFREITTMLQADKGTAGFVVPSIYKLYVNLTSTYVQHITPASSPQRPEQRQVVSADVLHAGVREIRAAMAADMKQRFPWTKLRHFAVASLLDPRTKVSDWGKGMCVHVFSPFTDSPFLYAHTHNHNRRSPSTTCLRGAWRTRGGSCAGTWTRPSACSRPPTSTTPAA